MANAQQENEAEVEEMAKALARSALIRTSVIVDDPNDPVVNNLIPSKIWWGDRMDDARAALDHVKTRQILQYRLDLPSVAGFYWVKCRGALSNHGYETIVKVSTTGLFGGSSKSSRPDTVFWDGVNVSIDDDRLSEFAGPIPRPEE